MKTEHHVQRAEKVSKAVVLIGLLVFAWMYTVARTTERGRNPPFRDRIAWWLP